MIPVKLHLKNFMSYKANEVLDFSGFDLAILNGDNGAGKSTLLEAITWALWGKSRAVSDDDLINLGQTSMWVEFIFDYEGNRYRVLRSRETVGRGSTTLEFQIAVKSDNPGHFVAEKTLTGEFAQKWLLLTGPTIKQTQDFIITTLKLDYDLFVNSSYLRQGHADEFTTKNPADRKEILGEILDLTLYDRLEEMAKAKRAEKEGEKELLTTQVADLTERIAIKAAIEKELTERLEEKKRLDILLKKKEVSLKEIEGERREFEAKERERMLLRQRYEELTREQRDLQHQEQEEEQAVREAEVILKSKETIERDFSKLKRLRKVIEQGNKQFALVARLREELSVLGHRENDLQTTIDRLHHVTVCPTCLRVMSKKEAETIIKKLTKQFDEEVGPVKEKLTKELTEIGFDESKQEITQQEINQLDGIEDKKSQLDIALATITKSKRLIEGLREKVKQAQKHQLEIVKKGKALGTALAGQPEKKEDWEKLEQETQETRDKLIALQDTIGGLKSRLAQIVDLEKEIGAKNAELTKVGQAIGLYYDLAVSFGKKGVQAMIIEETVPQIEEGANFLLQKITGGRMQVKIITQRPKKSEESEMIETLDIEISDELGSRPYEQYSGGEAFRINFAIRVALAKLLAIRAGAKLRFLAVDEGFGSLDTSGREDVVAAISGIKEDFSKIIVVTHIEEFKNLFPTRVEVTKDTNGSHIQVFSQ